MKNKKIAGLIAIFLCLSLLAACTPKVELEQSSQLPEAMKPEPTEGTQPSEPENIELEPLYTGQAKVKDIYRGTHHILNNTEEGQNYELSFPYIDLPGEDVAELNEKFLEQYMKRINEDGEFETVYAYSYDWYVNGDILSLVVTNQTWLNVWHYEAYNIKISTCKLLETEEVLAAAGVTEADFYAQAKDILGNAYFTRDYVSYTAPTDEDPIEYFYLRWENNIPPEALAATVSEENVARCTPYLNENGEVCFSAAINTGVGAELYGELFVWNDNYERSPHYEAYLEKFGT